MNKRNLLALCAVMLGWSAATSGSEPVPADMQKQLDQLKTQVRELQAQKTLPAYTAADVDAAVDSVGRDAEWRTHHLTDAAGITAGFMDDHFTIRSASGDFTMSPGVWMQFRSISNYNNKSAGANTDNGLEMRRLKITFEGVAFSKDLSYLFMWATNRKTGDLFNEQAYIRYKFADHWAVKVGSYKEIFYQETAVSPKKKLAIDVCMGAQALFDGDVFSQGIELNYDNNDNIQALLGITDGYASVNTNFQDPSANSYDFGINGRFQYKFFGDWKNYLDPTSLGTKSDLLVIGAGFDWSENNSIDTIRHGIDAQWESGKVGVFGGFFGKYTAAGNASDTWDYSFVIQAGYLVDAQWELFARYNYLRMDQRPAGSENTFHEITIGANYYLHSHAAKITLDFGWLPHGAPSNLDAIGILANDGGNEFYIRGQFQLYL